MNINIGAKIVFPYQNIIIYIGKHYANRKKLTKCIIVFNM